MAINMYTILTTCPDYGSRNVGDRLIEMRLKAIVREVKRDAEFFTIFREESLEPHLDRINASRAVLMPAFPIRDTPMHPGTYRLVEDLRRIRVPLVPIGANWNVYPGDEESRRTVRYSAETTRFLQHVAGQVDRFSCREPFTAEVLARHGIVNTLTTGDPAMFHLPSLGRTMKIGGRIERLVFSPPLSPFYAGQAGEVMLALARTFPAVRRYCAFHLADPGGSKRTLRCENSAAMSPAVAEKNRRMRQVAGQAGFEVLDLAGDIDRLGFYDDCDLHVGYECHAHLYFLSLRLPSLLIAEDARGVGFNHVFGVGGFDGFVRKQPDTAGIRKKVTSGYCTSEQERALAAPREDLPEQVAEFLARQITAGFDPYAVVASRLDRLYFEKMRPFIQALP